MIATPTLLTAPAPAQAADSVFYLSGTRNNPAPQQMIDLAELGSAFTVFGTQALQIGYPAALFPFQGAIGLDVSVAAGLASLLAALEAAPDGDRLVLIGVSQGDIVLSLLEHALAATGSEHDVLFVRMAGPSGDTGVMGRNWGFKLPGLSFVTRPAESPFDQIVLNHEYDGLGHWPVHQLNALAVLNAVMGMLAFHNPGSYAVDLSAFPEADITTTVNSLGATTTTYLIRATGLLPLLRPLRALGMDEALLNDWQRVLKPIIDSAYEPSTAPTLEQVVQSMVRVVVNSLSRVAESGGVILRRIEAAQWQRATVAIEATGEDQAVLGGAVPELEEFSAVRPRMALPGSPPGPEYSAATDTERAAVENDTAALINPTPAPLPDLTPEPQPGTAEAGGRDVEPDAPSDISEDAAVPVEAEQAVKSEDAAADSGSDRPADSPRAVTKTSDAKKAPKSAGSGSEPGSDSGSPRRSPRASLTPTGGSTPADDSDTATSSSRQRTTTPSTTDFERRIMRARGTKPAAATGQDAHA